MMGWLVVAAAIVAFYFYIYRNWNYKVKFTFKAVMIYLTSGMLLLSIVAVISMVKDAAEESRMDSFEYRMDSIESAEGEGKFPQLADTLILYDDYEPEFEYAWERVLMYTYYNRYLVFKEAIDAGMGEAYEAEALKYQEALFNICKEPTYDENIPYGQDFLERAGLLSNE